MMALNVVWQMVASKRFNYHEEGMKQLLHNQQGTIHILRNQLQVKGGLGEVTK